MIEQWPEFSEECPVMMAIPCNSGIEIRHQYAGVACLQFRVEGSCIPFPMPPHLVKIWGWDITDLYDPEDRRVDAIALQLAEYFRVPVEAIEVLGEALIKIGNFYLTQENSD